MSDKPTEYKKATVLEYIAWVQRGLNRELGSNLKDTGLTVAPYRALVWQLNENHSLPRSEEVGRETQDLLIQVNNAREDYMRWVQSSLATAGAYSGGVTGVLDTNTRDALFSFQDYQGLRGDAWVGPDTETWLIKVAGKTNLPGTYSPYVKPKPTPTPKVPRDPLSTAQRVESWARIFRDELLSDSTRDGQRIQRMRCVLGKMRSPVAADINDRYLDPPAVLWYFKEPLPKVGTFREDIGRRTKSLKSRLEDFALKFPGATTSSAAYLGFQSAFERLFEDVEKGLALIHAYHKGAIRQASMEVEGMKTSLLNTWALEKQSRVNDIYSCFRDK